MCSKKYSNMRTSLKSNTIIFLIHSLILQSTLASEAKLLIVTHNYNQPTFIELQYRTFKKFLTDDFEYVVFNDATDATLFSQIHETCDTLGIQCFNIPQENRTSTSLKLDLNKGQFWAAARHAEAIRYSMDTLAFNHPGLVMMIDSDMFLIKPFNAQSFIKDYDIAGLQQVRNENINYIWAGLIFFRMDKLPNKQSMNFKNGLINKTYVDSCGFLYYYFKENPRINIRYFEQPYRHFVDQNLRSFILPSHYNGNDFATWSKYLQCTCCKKNNAQCFHNDTILEELTFDETIIHYVSSKNFPPKIEFVLKSTLFALSRRLIIRTVEPIYST